MRMWMVDPKIMCRQHLLGEHLETHMIIGALKKGINWERFIKSNCIELTSVQDRHDELAEEMKRRGYQHKSDMEFDYSLLDTYDEVTVNCGVDRDKSKKLLLSRCKECKSIESHVR